MKLRNSCREEMGKEKGTEMMKELSVWDKTEDTNEYDTSGTQDSHPERSEESTI